MIKDALKFLVDLKDNKTYEIHGDTYSDNELVRITPHINRPSQISVTGLDSIVKLVDKEIGMMEDTLPVFIRVEGARKVSVFTSYDEVMARNSLYVATCDVPDFREGFRDPQQAIIELRSKFVPGEDVDYLLNLLSSINKENGVTTVDNGVSQQVEARTGISLKQMVTVKPRVTLCPYRTFLEVNQPYSEFILRLDENGNVGLFEADGGMWRLDAKRSVAAYFEDKLSELITAGKVVVMM